MKILVLGGNRYFGKHLVERLIKRGDSVTVLNRGSRKDDFGDRVTRVVSDRRHLSELPNAFKNQKWNIVYDQSGYDFEDSTIACEFFKDRVERYIFTSSLSVYGLGPGLHEEDFNPFDYKFTKVADHNQNYAEAKRQAESVFFQKAKFPVVAVRFPYVLGEDDYTERLKFHIEHVMHAKPIYFPNVQARVSMILASEAAHALDWIGQQEFTGPINCASSDPVKLYDLMKLIEEVTGMTALYAPASDQGEPSPYGVRDDWFMSMEKLHTLGLRLQPCTEWLPPLVRNVADRL